MTISVASHFTKARTILNDTGAQPRWTDAELLLWLNDAQREVVNLKPEANTKSIAVQLVGGTKQILPDGSVQFFYLTRNMGGDGLTVGTAIRLIDQKTLDSVDPNWHNATATDDVSECMADPFDPLRYSVNPPSVGGRYVEAVFGAIPEECVIGGNLTLPDVYANATLNYILHRAYAKDAEHAANAQLAQAYFAAFMSSVGGRAQADSARSGTP